MKIIQLLSDYIEDEIDDATKYAKLALECKDEYPALATAVYKISDEEIKHMMTLHEMVVSIINDFRKKNGEPPESMLMLYDILHGKQIEHMAKAKAYQSMYKE